MNEMDELCRMLDERGVEHEGGERSLRWRDRHGIMMQAFPLADGELGMEVWSCTPEQAIAATLGSFNCTNSERTSDELLPCPFCGGEARIITTAGESWVLCDECKATTEAHTSRQIAIAAWNRRAES